MTLQRTLKKRVILSGIGLHTGKWIRVQMNPAPPNSGIVFVRTDLEGSPRLATHYKNIIHTQLATTLGDSQATLSTVEHILAAFQYLKIDNALIEVSGPEIPILDGSAIDFCTAMMAVGFEDQAQYQPYLQIRKKIELHCGDKWIIATPADSFEIHGSIEWNHPLIGYQEFVYQEGKTKLEELMGARTFGFIQDVEQMKKGGFIRGGSLENAIILDDTQVLNPEGLRFKDEFVRHKILDALGDFKLAGIPIRASIRLHRAGHDLHQKFLTEIFRHPDHYQVVCSAVESDKQAEESFETVRVGLSHAYSY